MPSNHEVRRDVAEGALSTAFVDHVQQTMAVQGDAAAWQNGPIRCELRAQVLSASQ